MAEKENQQEEGWGAVPTILFVVAMAISIYACLFAVYAISEALPIIPKKLTDDKALYDFSVIISIISCALVLYFFYCMVFKEGNISSYRCNSLFFAAVMGPTCAALFLSSLTLLLQGYIVLGLDSVINTHIRFILILSALILIATAIEEVMFSLVTKPCVGLFGFKRGQDYLWHNGEAFAGKMAIIGTVFSGLAYYYLLIDPNNEFSQKHTMIATVACMCVAIVGNKIGDSIYQFIRDGRIERKAKRNRKAKAKEETQEETQEETKIDSCADQMMQPPMLRSQEYWKRQKFRTKLRGFFGLEKYIPQTTEWFLSSIEREKNAVM